mmetsp:Transcript_14139/g.19696  ORF Transcript_14139/g.19696 Transcript_14139/m.19696 type:complete len:273 (-) Transcript_14139:1355-2173(-)|eukprot:CAMPEP_0168577004 /NCGR_PEP_ID=MMETSP0413-20121227/20552_1 /TAXON_ID=136452 /ORGANISM="Filamoeba nolandi, Strain NC-AS-23-1" /LENGTH=272 /DNA_ID=CAMNT_0008610723 /DNA_START=10 /DNA_END=828 /DNA_ORIENTATION=+
MAIWDLLKQGVGLAFLILAGCTFVIEFCYTRFILRRLRNTRTLSTTDARAIQHNERRRQENTERIQEETNQRAQTRRRIQEEQYIERNQWVVDSNKKTGGQTLRSTAHVEEESLSATQLMQLQDYEFERALEIDRQKEREVEGKQAKQELHKAFRHQLESLIPPEPSPSTSEKCCKIAVRLSNGSRVQRNFLMTDKLKDVFNFVHTKEIFNLTKFSLINNFPKRTFVLGDDTMQTEDQTNNNNYIVTEETLADLKFSPSEAFFVEPLEYLPE